jgi:hypothetical protein
MGNWFAQKEVIERVGDFALAKELNRDLGDQWCYTVRNVKTGEVSVAFRINHAKKQFDACVERGKFVPSPQITETAYAGM